MGSDRVECVQENLDDEINPELFLSIDRYVGKSFIE